MQFYDYDFEAMNETDVREEIVQKWLADLGYRTGTSNSIIREQSLRYPKVQLGRRKENDPILRGKADYICTVGETLRWVVEVKAPAQSLDETVIAQAWSYAVHPEVRAVCFVITNGKSFKVFSAFKGPEALPIISWEYNEFSQRLQTIKNLLSPEALSRDHPSWNIDIGDPIGPGLRSIVRIVGGRIRYNELSIQSTPLLDMVMTVTGGSVERNPFGQLEATLNTLVPFQSLQSLNERLGLDHLLLKSDNHAVSINENNPTLFQSRTQVVLPKGIEILNMMDWQMVALPLDITVIVTTKAQGCLQGRKFAGSFSASMLYVEVSRSVDLDGAFDLMLS